MKVINFESPTHLAPDQNFYDQFPFTEIPDTGLSLDDMRWLTTRLARYRSKKGVSLPGLLALGQDFNDLHPEQQLARVNDARLRLNEVLGHSILTRKGFPMTEKTSGAVAIIKGLRPYPLIWSYVTTQWDPGIYDQSGNVLNSHLSVLPELTESYPNWGQRRPKMQGRMQAIGLVLESSPAKLRWQLTTN